MRSSLTESRAIDVATLVGLREHDQLGRIATVDHGLHRRGDGDAGKLPAEVACCVHLGGAVLAERTGKGRCVATDERRDIAPGCCEPW